MASAERQKRLADNMARVVAEILHTELKEPLPAVLTVTGVELTKDLSAARVYYTVLGEATAAAATAGRLSKVASFVQREVGKRLHLRVTPALKFVYDDQAARGDRVLRLLSELKRDDPD